MSVGDVYVGISKFIEKHTASVTTTVIILPTIIPSYNSNLYVLMPHETGFTNFSHANADNENAKCSYSNSDSVNENVNCFTLTAEDV